MSTPSGRTGYPKFNAATDTPDGAAQDEAVSDHFDELVGESKPTLTDLPASDNWPGRTIWVEAVGVGFRVWTGSAWVPERGVKRATGTSGGVPTTLTSVASLVLPAGTWDIRGRAYFEVSTVSARSYTLQLWNSTSAAQVDVATIGGVGSGLWPVTVEDIVTLTASTTIQMRASVSGSDGTQLLTNGKLFAQQVAFV